MTTDTNGKTLVEEVSTLVVGAGPGGICVGVMLLEQGVDDFAIVEKSDSVGGTWNLNRYPGLACDAPADLYSFSFAPHHDWSGPYARRDEMLAYLRAVTTSRGLHPHLRLGAGVLSARWLEDEGVWYVMTTRHDFRAKVLVGAVGMFNEPSIPAIPGLHDTFQGSVVHTAAWPDDDFQLLHDRQVAVIGSAASAVQIVPSVAGHVAHLDVYHRTPNWVFPKDDDPYSEEHRQERRRDQSIAAGKREEARQFFEVIDDFNNDALMAELRQKALRNLQSVEDPQLRTLLTPRLPLGAQRPLQSSQYYRAFNRPNVALVTSPIQRVMADAIQTSDGQRRPADTIVLGTGYHAHKFFSIVEILGREGRTLSEVWADGAYAYLGMVVEGFPNMFMLYGPNSNGGSIITKLETQARYIVGKVLQIRRQNLRRLEVRPEVVAAYNAALQEKIRAVDAWQYVGSRYYRAPSGRIVTQCPYSPAEYDRLTQADDDNAFDRTYIELPSLTQACGSDQTAADRPQHLHKEKSAMTVTAAETLDARQPDFAAWIEQFHRDGFIVVENALEPGLIDQLKKDLDKALADQDMTGMRGEMELRMFERSPANVGLFEHEPIVTFAEKLIGDDRPEFGAEHVHVVHNNAFRTRKSQGIAHWHQDEPPYYLVTEGQPPSNVRLPVLLFTCNYYLTDVDDIKYGPTEFIPGSHLFGAAPPEVLDGTQWENQSVAALGKKGTALIFSNQVWHRGSPNRSDRVRYVTQVSYAHRTIGHRYYPFMNYIMPEHVYRDANPRLKRLLGWVPTGPYDSVPTARPEPAAAQA